jgi:hypothetical protein
MRAVLVVCALASTTLLTAACGDSCAAPQRGGGGHGGSSGHSSGGYHSSGGSSSCSGSSSSYRYHDYDDDDDDSYSGSDSGSDDSSSSSGTDDSYDTPGKEFPSEADPGDATQMITVYMNAQYGPELTTWRKDASGGWVEEFSAVVPGDDGVDVPYGTFPVTTAFGNEKAPEGTVFPYKRVTGDSFKGVDLSAGPEHGLVVYTAEAEDTLIQGHGTPGDTNLRFSDDDVLRIITWLDPDANPRITFYV